MEDSVTVQIKDPAATDETQPMSKNQLKKLRKKEKWEAVKHERRKAEKQTRKRKRGERRERGEDLGPTRKNLKKNMMKNSSCKIRVVIDLSLDEYMTDKDASSLLDQIRYCYSDNRRAANPMQLYFCGSSGKTMKRLDDLGDCKGWDVQFDSRSYNDAFPKESLVYLSSDSDNVLSTLSDDKVYVIGGLVDHNKHKGICHQLAEEKGIAHAQLPIGDYMNLKSRKVLAVNHVYTILLKFTETNDWKEAFLSVIPQRKQASLKEKETDATAQENEEVRKADDNENVDSVVKHQSDTSEKNNTSPNIKSDKLSELDDYSTDVTKKDDSELEHDVKCHEVTEELQADANISKQSDEQTVLPLSSSHISEENQSK